jgi:ATP phosphoribosyltransferase
MQQGVFDLLKGAGLRLHVGAREYRPSMNLSGFEVKILKPQNIIEMLHAGKRDVGFAGADWVAELEADLVELLDTGLDPVRMVVAAPPACIERIRSREPGLLIASEYERLTTEWMAREGLGARVVRSYGATEVLPPEDADAIVDITQSGATLASNGLEIADELMRSSTRLYANPRSLDDPAKRVAIEDLAMLLRSVLDARSRVMLELNVTAEHLDGVLALLPCMREPTISPLAGKAGFALKAAVPRTDLPALIPKVKAAGGSDLVVTEPAQIVP